MLRLVDRYVIRETIPYILLGILLLTAIIFAHEAGRFVELLVVASRKGLPMEGLARVIAALIPGILLFTLPISLLIGTLVGLGRLSGDSEIVALGASGVSRFHILRPVMAVALAVAAAMFYITFTLLPTSVRNLNDLKANQTLVLQGLNTQIKPRIFEEGIPKKVLYIEDIDRLSNQWRNVFLVDLDGEHGEMKIFTAAEGMLRQGDRSEMPELFLRKISLHQTGDKKSDSAKPDDQDAEEPDAENGSPDREKKKKQQNYTVAQFGEMTIGMEVTGEQKAEAVGAAGKPPALQEMEWGQLLSHTPAAGEARKWWAEIHRRLTLPAACLTFALLAVGFGISNVRTGRSFGLLLGLAITITYYLLALTGEHAALTGKLPIWLGMWMANCVLAAFGLLILVIQRRPGADALSALRRLRHALRRPGRDAEADRVGERGSGGAGEAMGNSPIPPLPHSPTLSRLRSRFRRPRAQLLDRLVLSDAAKSFLFILAGFTTLFIIITLFQLLNAIARHNIEWAVVANYLFFLTPMVVNYMTPIAALVAVMVTFGVLQKTSQVVALTASGQSIYRLAAPLVLSALLLSALVFVNQDYILPFTNPRQHNLRHLIRSGQEPPQTFYQTTNQWIFGVDSRIFNYAHFDPTNNRFARLNILDLSRDPFGIRRRVNARRAWWDEDHREWVLENGWERRFDGERLVAFEQFKERRYALPEQPAYFKKDARGSQSLTLAELRRQIDDLSRSGFDVLDLKIAFQGKIAFPLTCLIMVLVGLPFSFSVGKRGALYGVTIGIAIGLSYWGLIGLFEQMGRYEILPPTLAAWGPNLLFGAGGLYLFLTSRT